YAFPICIYPSTIYYCICDCECECIWIFDGYIISMVGYCFRKLSCIFRFSQMEPYTLYEKLQQRTSVQRLIHFIDRKGVIPIFILLCFSFTPSALVNLVVSLSHIRAHVYLVVLFSSKLIMIGLIGWLGNDITTLFTQPLRLVIIIIVIIVVWFIGRKLERYFMHSPEE